jgi:hypothetical protein
MSSLNASHHVYSLQEKLLKCCLFVPGHAVLLPSSKQTVYHLGSSCEKVPSHVAMASIPYDPRDAQRAAPFYEGISSGALAPLASNTSRLGTSVGQWQDGHAAHGLAVGLVMYGLAQKRAEVADEPVSRLINSTVGYLGTLDGFDQHALWPRPTARWLVGYLRPLALFD